MIRNHSQDIAMIETRMAMRMLVMRVLWSLGAGLATLTVRIFFGPPRMLMNLIDYAWASIVVAFERDVRTGGVERKAIFEMVKYQYLIMRQKADWVWSLGMAVAVVLIAFGLLTYLFWKRGSREELDRVTRGAQLVTPKLHNRILRRTYGKKPPKDMGRALVLGEAKAIVPEAVQYKHFAFAGAGGGGKSTAIAEVIEQAISRGDKGLVVDLGGSLYSKFGRPGDHVLSLRDPRSEWWDFWHEEGVPEEAMAAAMIEEDAMGNTYFWKGARAVLASLLRRTKTAAELWADFKKPSKELRAKLADADELSRRVMGDNDSDQADGIIGTTVLDFSFLKELNQWAEGQEPFSVARWINDHSDSSWTYILFTEADLEIAKPLLRVWFDIACLAALQRDEDDPSNRHTWLILDEVKTLGRLHSLPTMLDKGRKYKTSVVVGYQAMSQFEKVYGKEDTRSMLQGLQNQFHFHVTESAAAEYVSELMGEQEVEQTSVGMSYGTAKVADRSSFNRALVRKRLVMPEDVRALEPLTAFVRLGHHQPFKLTFETKERPRQQDRAISRQRIVAPNSKPSEVSEETVARKAPGEPALPGSNAVAPSDVPGCDEENVFVPKDDKPS